MERQGEDGVGCIEHQMRLRKWLNQAWGTVAATTLSGSPSLRLLGVLWVDRESGMRNTWVSWEPEAPHPRLVRNLIHTIYHTNTDVCGHLPPTSQSHSAEAPQPRGRARCLEMAALAQKLC